MPAATRQFEWADLIDDHEPLRQLGCALQGSSSKRQSLVKKMKTTNIFAAICINAC